MTNPYPTPRAFRTHGATGELKFGLESKLAAAEDDHAAPQARRRHLGQAARHLAGASAIGAGLGTFVDVGDFAHLQTHRWHTIPAARLRSRRRFDFGGRRSPSFVRAYFKMGRGRGNDEGRGHVHERHCSHGDEAPFALSEMTTTNAGSTTTPRHRAH